MALFPETPYDNSASSGRRDTATDTRPTEHTPGQPIYVQLDKEHRVRIDRHVDGIGVIQECWNGVVWRPQQDWGLSLHHSYMDKIADAIKLKVQKG